MIDKCKNMSLKIYTKTGDEGKTSLLGGTKVLKSNLRIEAYGTVDELNSHIGYINDYIPDEATNTFLREVQNNLFVIGSLLAADPAAELKMQLPGIHEKDIEALEMQIDTMDKELPPLKNFILPGGHVAVSATHIARCVCRRAERCCVAMKEHELSIQPIIIKYLNRLSDYLFMLARFTAQLLHVEEVEWKPRS